MKITIGILGDAQYFPREIITPILVQRLLEIKPNLVIQLGDHGQKPGSLPQWESFKSFMKPLDRAQIPWYALIGNHEVKRSFQRDLHHIIFPKPENSSWFSIDAGPSLLIIGDTEWVERFDKNEQRGKIAGEQYLWLAGLLAKNPNRPKLFFCHRPLYPPFWHVHKDACLDQYPEHRDRLCRLLSENGTLATISGHEHIFHFVARKGMAHFISGAGGTALRFDKGRRDIFYHILSVTICTDSDIHPRFREKGISLYCDIKAIDLKGRCRRHFCILEGKIVQSNLPEIDGINKVQEDLRQTDKKSKVKWLFQGQFAPLMLMKKIKEASDKNRPFRLIVGGDGTFDIPTWQADKEDRSKYMDNDTDENIDNGEDKNEGKIINNELVSFLPYPDLINRKERVNGGLWLGIVEKSENNRAI